MWKDLNIRKEDRKFYDPDAGIDLLPEISCYHIKTHIKPKKQPDHDIVPSYAMPYSDDEKSDKSCDHIHDLLSAQFVKIPGFFQLFFQRITIYQNG
jgi:hypothetical protein